MQFAVLKVNAKKHMEAVIKECDGWKVQCQEITLDRDTWKNWCQEVATGILPVLNLIDPMLTEDAPGTPQLGLVDRC